MKKTKERIQAENLIARLDKMAENYREVALLTPVGLIYSWQTNKLLNLRVVFEAIVSGQRVYEDPPGFVAITSENDDEDDSVTVKVWPLFDPKTEGPTFALDALLDSVNSVWEAYQQEYRYERTYVNADFRLATGTMIR